MPATDEKNQLLEKLENPETIQALNRLLDRVESLEKGLSLLEESIQSVPGAISTVVETMDEYALEAMEQGVDIEERMNLIGQILTKLSHPNHLRVLNEFLDTAPNILPMLQALKDLPGIFALTVDTIDELYDKGEITAIIDSGVFDPAALNTVGMLGKSLVESRKNSKPIGLLGLLGALRDPAVQSSLGFLIGFAKAFGNQLKQNSNNGKYAIK